MATRVGRKFTDKAFNRWKEEFPWVDRHPTVPDVAYCSCCKQSLQAKRDKLLSHSVSRSHLTLFTSKVEGKQQFNSIIIENIVPRQNNPSLPQTVQTASVQQVSQIQVAPSNQGQLISATNAAGHLVAQSNQVGHLVTSTDQAGHLVTSAGQAGHLVTSADQAGHLVTSADQAGQQLVSVSTTDELIVGDSADNIITNSLKSSGLQSVQVHSLPVELTGATAADIVQEVKSEDVAALSAADLGSAHHLQTLSAAGLRTVELKDGTYIVHDVPIKVVEVQGDDINLGMINIEDNSSSIGALPFAKIQANAQFPSNIKTEMKQRFLSAEGWDATWKCADGRFKIHKFIMALFSPLFKRLLDSDETESCVYTPDLTCVEVKSVLCLLYTGSVLLTDESLSSRIESVLSLLECSGSIRMEAYDSKKSRSEGISNLSFETFRKRKRKDNDTRKPDKSKTKKAKVDQSLEEEELDYDSGLLEEPHSPDSSSVDDSRLRSPGERRMTSLKSTAGGHTKLETDLDKIKVELEEDFEHDPLTSTGLLDLDDSALLDDQDEDKENYFHSDDDGRDGAGGLDDQTRERYRDTRFRYYLKGNRCGKVKGALSRDLKIDLFDHPPEDLLSITVCPICYLPFQSKDSCNLHKMETHKDWKEKKKGPYCIDEFRYKCPTCGQVIEVSHIVWFVKHMRFCDKDKVKALEILGPEDSDIVIKNTEQIEEQDGSEEDVLTCKRGSGKKMQNLTQVLFGKCCDAIWGCRTCYEVFPTKSDLEQHRVKDHDGKLYHGSCYDEQSKMYTCMYCNLSSTYSHLVYFIRHIRQCLVDPSVGLSKDHEEEGLEDDTTEDVIDPWGVINKPMKVVNQRSHWISESLFGKYVPIVYPCHVCYNAFPDEREIKEHFSTVHPDVENCVENGPHYNKDKDCYSCPVCKKEVCRSQRNSVYFTYHLKKCNNKTFPVTKTCPKCDKSFNNYRSYMAHQRNNCESNEFLCHICSFGLKSKQDLARHVQYVHSDARPYMCLKCPKRFKRKADLGIHEQTHNSTLSFSCEHCGKAFNQRRGLRTHIQTHLSYLDKPHQCSFCTMRFVRKQTLDNHMSTHQDTKRFSCDVCGVRVKTKDALRSHRKKVHKLIGAIPASTELITVEAIPAVAANTVISNSNVKEETMEMMHFPIVS